MTYKTPGRSIAWRVLLLFITLTAASWFLINSWYVYLCITIPVIIYQVIEFYNFQRKAQAELAQFVESVHYRDFSRYFDVKHAPVELQPLRQGFNEINTTFKVISKEKETQYQYLQKILDLVNTGILSYDEKEGTVVWMNESLKRMLQLPYLKTIHTLQKRDPGLYREIIALKPGDNKIGVAHLERTTFRILLSGTAFQTDGVIYKLVAFQNVNEALDETESKAWQKLLNVMTHEIMNSIAPISSLADTLKNRVQRSVNTREYSNGTLEDLEVGIETIKKRSEGLLKFAETYRSLNKITSPNLKKVLIRDLFENLQQLMQPTLDQKNIEMEIILQDTESELQIDPSLIEQVLINLVVNSIEAVKDKDDGRIVLSAFRTSNKTIIKVSDNGIGMPEDVMEKIFIPFFTTRKNGSGIGLSLCKQIMMLHSGNIYAQSKKGIGTAFILQF
jgi:signal transduction histidine kinase